MSVVCDRACRAQLLKFWSKVIMLVCYYHCNNMYECIRYVPTKRMNPATSFVGVLRKPWLLEQPRLVGVCSRSESSVGGYFRSETCYRVVAAAAAAATAGAAAAAVAAVGPICNRRHKKKRNKTGLREELCRYEQGWHVLVDKRQKYVVQN